MTRRLHLATGLVLFAYVLSHALNHALGLVSLDALEAGRRLFLALWRNPAGTAVLYGAFVVHLALALRAIYRRRSLAMPVSKAVQIVLGLSVPPLLALHVLGTRFAHDVFGVNDNYVYILLIYFVFSPWLGIKQAIVMIVAWIHGCIGLHFWLCRRPWYQRVRLLVRAGAVAVPVVSLLGVYVAGRNVLDLAADPAWLERAVADSRFADATGLALIEGLETGIIAGFGGLLGVVLMARAVRSARARARPPVAGDR